MNEKKNILEVYYEPSFSGITRHVGQIVEHLKGNPGLSFHILCSTNDERIPEYYKKLGVPVETVSGAKYFSFKGMWKAFRIVKKRKISHVHIHNLQSIFWANSSRIILPGVKFYFTPHIINFENQLVDSLFYFIWRYFSVFTDKVIALSGIQKIYLVAKGIKSEEDIPVIPNSITPIDETILTEKYKEENPLDISSPSIVSVIRLVRQKQPFKIIDIAREICRHFPDATFYIVGDGPLYEKLQRRILEEGLERRVIVTGFRRDALRILHCADIVLSTSKWEGLPYTLLEAMYLGKPIIASDIDGHRPLIKNGQIGYLATSSEDYIQKISHLLENRELRKEMGGAGRKYFDRYFSFDLFLNNIRDLYKI
ncbi:glycosyltransferase family 4 protein [Candidatus Sumerlaeota bacterium]|nr:glycosyltransferase family 4 protein [Candidatus Sumerlaeota bacterium]